MPQAAGGPNLAAPLPSLVLAVKSWLGLSLKHRAAAPHFRTRCPGIERWWRSVRAPGSSVPMWLGATECFTVLLGDIGCSPAQPQPHCAPAPPVLGRPPTLLICSRSFRGRIRSAHTMPALVPSRSMARAPCPAAGLSGVFLSFLGFAATLSMPSSLGFAPVHGKAFGLARLNGASPVRERQRNQDSRILVDVTGRPAGPTLLTTRSSPLGNSWEGVERWGGGQHVVLVAAGPGPVGVPTGIESERRVRQFP